MNFPRGTGVLSGDQPHLRPDSGRIAGRPFESHAQPRFRALVVKQPGRSVVLGHDQIDSSIGVIITKRGASLLAIDLNSAFLARHSLKIPAAIASQPQTPARVVSGSFHLHAKEVLAQENVFTPIAVIIPDTHT